MGLDDYIGDKGIETSGRSRVNKQTKDTNTIDDAYKVVECNGRKKIFPNEDDWNETVDIIENEMHMSIAQVMSMNPSDRYNILHQAILQKNGMHSVPFHQTRDCLVCGKTFTFPNNWSFVEFRGEPVCPDHKIEQVIQSYSNIGYVEEISWG